VFDVIVPDTVPSPEEESGLVDLLQAAIKKVKSNNERHKLNK
jgi:hypothetical protein